MASIKKEVTASVVNEESADIKANSALVWLPDIAWLPL